MNPEFQRHLWMQFSPLKIILAPLLLAIVVFGLQSSQGLTPVEITEGAFWTFHVIMGFWATRRSADALAEEISSGTWNIQRMSSLSAWQMTWGKILGATAYTWYCSFWLLAILLFYGHDFQEKHVFSGHPILLAGELILTALSAIAVSFIVLLLLHQKSSGSGKISTTLAQLAGLASYALIQSGAFIQLLTEGYGTVRITWYGYEVESPSFLLFSVFFVTVWIWIGAYRGMQSELQYKQSPIVFMLFLVIFFSFLYGFSLSAYNLINLLWAYVVLTYLAFFSERKNLTLYRSWLGMQNGEAKIQAALTPLWPIAYGTTIILGMGILMSVPDHSFPTFGISMFDDIYGKKNVSALLLIPSSLLFLGRDLLFLLWMNFWKKKNADLTGVLLLFIVYWPLASLLNWIGLGYLNGIARPGDYSSEWANFGPVISEILILLLLLRQNLMKTSRSREAYAS